MILLDHEYFTINTADLTYRNFVTKGDTKKSDQGQAPTLRSKEEKNTHLSLYFTCKVPYYCTLPRQVLCSFKSYPPTPALTILLLFQPHRFHSFIELI